MRAGDILKNTETGEARFRVKDLIAEGRSYFIAEGEDIHLDDLRVVLKAIRYPDDASAELIQQRRAGLKAEVEALTVPSILLPEPVDFFTVAADVGVGGDASEPVLVLEYHSGKTLRDELARTPGGMPPARALRIVHELALALDELHTHGWIYRDLNPDHIIIGIDDILHLVGTGNLTRAEARPNPFKQGVSDLWSAPEIRDEISGKFLRAEADVYSLGALLAWLLTGVEPTPRVEAPLHPDAYARLMELPEGYRLLVARCLQPLAKRRFRAVSALLPWLHEANLPNPASRGFANLDLPVPHTPDGQVDLNNRALRSHLSTGPLISVPRDKPTPAPTTPPPQPTTPAQPNAENPRDLPAKVATPWWKSCFPWLALPVLTVALLLLLLGAFAS